MAAPIARVKDINRMDIYPWLLDEERRYQLQPLYFKKDFEITQPKKARGWLGGGQFDLLRKKDEMTFGSKELEYYFLKEAESTAIAAGLRDQLNVEFFLLFFVFVFCFWLFCVRKCA